jgi:hypothetical protein
MYIPFNEISDQARVWVYQANRPLSQPELDGIKNYLTREMADWAAHGEALQGSFDVRFHQVFVVAVDEQVNQASGCSIDASTRWFKELGADLGVDFFDRSCAVVEGESLTLISLLRIKQAVIDGILKADSLVIPLQTADVAAYRSGWLASAEATWLGKYFQPQNA